MSNFHGRFPLEIKKNKIYPKDSRSSFREYKLPNIESILAKSNVWNYILNFASYYWITFSFSRVFYFKESLTLLDFDVDKEFNNSKQIVVESSPVIITQKDKMAAKLAALRQKSNK